MSAQQGKYSLGDIEYRPLGPDPVSTIENEAKGFGLRVSTHGGMRSPAQNRASKGSPTSLHLVDDARDLAGDPGSMSKFYRHMRTTYGPNLKELYYDPEGGFKNGEDIGAIGKHGDHVHVSIGQRGQFKLSDALPANSVTLAAAPVADGAAVSTSSAPPPANPFNQPSPEIGITPLINRAIKEGSGQPRPVIQPAIPNVRPVPKGDEPLQTEFESAKSRGDIEAANRAGLELQKRGWVFMPGQSTLGPSGYEPGWPSIKPPGSDRPDTGQGTEKFAAGQRAERATPPRSHRKMYVPGIGDVGPVAEGAVDVAAGATAPIVRAIQGIYRAPGAIADELRRVPSIPGVYTAPDQPTGPQVRPSYQSNPIEQGVGKLADTIEEFAQQHGLPVGVAKELANAAGGLAPLLLLKNPASIGGMTAAEAYGRGDSLYDALKKGAEQTAVMHGMGGGAKALDEVLSTPGVYKAMREAGVSATAARPAAIAAGTGGRTAGRTAVNVAAPNVIRAATGQDMHPVTVPEVVTGTGFALAHGVGTGPGAEPREPRAQLIPPGEPIPELPEGVTTTKVRGVGTFVHSADDLTHAEVRAEAKAATTEGRGNKYLQPTSGDRIALPDIEGAGAKRPGEQGEEPTQVQRAAPSPLSAATIPQQTGEYKLADAKPVDVAEPAPQESDTPAPQRTDAEILQNVLRAPEAEEHKRFNLAYRQVKSGDRSPEAIDQLRAATKELGFSDDGAKRIETALTPKVPDEKAASQEAQPQVSAAVPEVRSGEIAAQGEVASAVPKVEAGGKPLAPGEISGSKPKPGVEPQGVTYEERIERAPTVADLENERSIVNDHRSRLTSEQKGLLTDRIDQRISDLSAKPTEPALVEPKPRPTIPSPLKSLLAQRDIPTDTARDVNKLVDAIYDGDTAKMTEIGERYAKGTDATSRIITEEAKRAGATITEPEPERVEKVIKPRSQRKQASNDQGIIAAIRSRGGIDPNYGGDIASYFSNKEGQTSGVIVRKSRGGKSPEDMLASLIEDGWFQNERGAAGETYNRGERMASDILLDAMRNEQGGKVARPADYDYHDEIEREASLGPIGDFVSKEDGDILYRKALKNDEWSNLFYKVVSESDEPSKKDILKFRKASQQFGISDDAVESILASGEHGRSTEATDFTFGEDADVSSPERGAAEGATEPAGERPEDVDYQHFDNAIREPSADYKSKLSADDYQRVVAKLDSLKAEAKGQGRPLSTVLDEYMRQGDLFSGHELSDDQQALLRQLAERGKRAALHAEQGGLFAEGIKPTVESRLEQQKGEDRGGGFGGGGSLFEPKAAYGEPAPPFYSQLERTLENSQQAKFSPEQLEGVLKKSGVKPDEMKWTGFDDFLAEKKREGKPVTKAEALEIARQNAVEVREVTKASKSGYDYEGNEWQTAINQAEARGDFDEAERINRAWEGLDEETGSTAGMPKFSQWQIPGGENYRELLLTLPQREAEKSPKPAPLTELPEGYRPIRDAKAPTERRYGVIPPGQVHGRFMGGAHPTQEAAMAEALKLVNNERLSTWAYESEKKADASSFKSGHFDEPNVLAHIRFNERADSEGHKVLFIEEVQSDWHQKGRKSGYAPSEIRRAELETRREDLLRLGRDATPEQKQEWADVMNELQPNNSSRVPDAPFKTTWPDLAMKRAIRWAAENGFDKVAWTTGEQQAERYDLSKHISEVMYNETTQGLQARDLNGELVITESNITPEKLVDYIGKEAAQRLLEQTPEKVTARGAENNRIRRLVGENLKVGGEGMKGFYDKILPSVASKLGKKFGAKVGETTFNTQIEPTHEPSPTGGFMQGRIVDKQQSATVHSLDITDSMRASAMQGQALFEPKAKYGESQQIGIFKGDKLVGTASLSQSADPGEWVKANYGPGYDHGPLTMENEPRRLTEGPDKADSGVNEQLSFDYARRPGTDKAASTELARAAIAAVERAGDTAVSSRSDRPASVQPEYPVRSGAKTLGVGITGELVNKGRVDLRGQTVKEPADVARVAQVFRDPRFETLRIIYTRGDKIVGHEGITSRMPGAALAFKKGRESRDLQDMRERMARLGADGYYLLHNHPSGHADPSQEDVNLSTYYQHGEMDAKGNTKVSGVPGFKGHVVIDSGEYAVIAPNFFGRASEVPISKLATGSDKLLTPSVPHDFLNAELNSPSKVAALGKQMQAPEGFVTVLYTDAKHNLRAIQEVPRALLLRPKEGADFLRGQRRAFGAGNSVIYSATGDTELKTAALKLFKSSDVFEYVDSNGPYGKDYYSAHEQAPSYGRQRETVPQPRRVSEDKPDYGDIFDDLYKEFGIPKEGEKERALPKTLEEADLQGGRDRTYIPETERGWMDAAHKTLADKGAKGTAEYLKGLQAHDLSGKDVATAAVYLDNAEKEIANATGAKATELTNAAIDVASSLAERLTRAGQVIRAVQVVNRLSPARALLVAERMAEKVLKRQLTPEEGARFLGVSTKLRDAEGTVQELENRIAKETNLKQREPVKPRSERAKKPGNALDFLRKEAQAAVARITEKTGRAAFQVKEPSSQYGSPDDSLLDDYAAYGAHMMAKGMTRPQWEADMKEKFGDDLSLKEIGERAYRKVADARKRVVDPGARLRPKTAYREIGDSIRATAASERAETVKAGRRARDWQTPIKEDAAKATGSTVDDMVAVAAEKMLDNPGPRKLKAEMTKRFGDDFRQNWPEVQRQAYARVEGGRKTGNSMDELRRGMKEAGFEGDVASLTDEKQAAVKKLLEQRKAVVKERAKQRVAMAQEMAGLQHTRLNTADSVLKANLLAGLGPYSHKVGSLLSSTVIGEARNIGAGMADAFRSAVFGGPRSSTVDLAGLGRSLKRAVTVGGKETGQILRYGYTERGLEQGESGIGRPAEEHAELPAVNPLVAAANRVFRAYKAGAHIFGTEHYERTKGAIAKAMAINEAKEGIIGRSEISRRAQEIYNGDTVTPEQQGELELASVQAYVNGIFQGNNAVNDLMKRIRGNERGLWAFVINRKVPFMRSASNVMLETLNYAGIGPRGVLAETGKMGYRRFRTGDFFENNQQRRDFAKAWGALPVGMSLMALGAYLHRKELLTSLMYEKNKNPQPGSLGIGGKLIDISRYSPPGLLMAFGATIDELWGQKRKHKGEETETSLPAAIEAGLGEMVSHLPLMQLGNIAQELKEGTLIQKEVGSMATSLVPAAAHEAYKAHEKSIRRRVPVINPVVEKLGAKPTDELPEDKGYPGQVLRIRPRSEGRSGGGRGVTVP